ncbi:MAG TPA: DUF523 and DUF1722 domain-containing protein [Methylomirabilota bacterium]|jgi:uncharacterized protein YbbK (DUF523 family)/uncharacterized protein YbgA (DUF1722 family)
MAVAAWRSPDLTIRLGISACLLGEEVRYDGGHQKDAYLTGVLGRHVTWVSVCPEMEVGMGVPREPIRLVGDAAAPRLLGVTSGADHTDRMNEFARRRVQELARRGLSGYVLKRGSPSCGVEGVKLYRDEGAPPERAGVGLFARVLREALPLLPVEEEGRLDDARRRDGFITRVFAYRRLAALREMAPRPEDVVAFYAAHEYLLRAHSPAAAARLGRLVARPPRGPLPAWLDRYGAGFMRALQAPATRARHADVLRHVAGRFARRLRAAERRELLGLIAAYAAGLTPRIVPITLINHHAARLDVADLHDQVYLHPHPKELMLRHHA